MTDYTPAEQKEHRRLWVEALRSGQFNQGTGVLHDATAGSFCCLGVGCEISHLDEWHPSSGAYPRYFDAETLLPVEVRDWLGLRGSRGGFAGSASIDGYHYLTDLNDNGKTFAEIADIIESEPAGLIATPSVLP